MCPGNGFTDAWYDATHHHALAPCSCYQVELITTIVGLLHQGQRQRDALFAAPIEINVRRAIIDTDDFVISRVNADALATGVAPLFEEVLVNLLANHAHLTMLLDIHLIDKASVIHLGSNDLGIFRSDALDIR